MSVDSLVAEFGLTTKDAVTLLSLDDGDRLDYFLGVMVVLKRDIAEQNENVAVSSLGKMTGNW